MPKSWPTRLGTVRYCVHVIVEQHRIIITEFNCTAKIQPSTCKQLPPESITFLFFPRCALRNQWPCNEKWAKRVKPQAEIVNKLGSDWNYIQALLGSQPVWREVIPKHNYNEQTCTCKLHIKPLVCRAVCCVTMKLVLKKEISKTPPTANHFFIPAKMPWKPHAPCRLSWASSSCKWKFNYRLAKPKGPGNDDSKRWKKIAY